ncbi:MAG: response regulator [Euryarchaeota archaeon]|uniref:ATP-binding response regulator n=1 Tax=Methanobacterium sp. MZD130B TaxID=3394378 RepID=UPI0017791F63|nr:response regulator [Euryarchaeota archaeon]HHT19741.1 response regulator [Methanobacterium sp.]
MSTVKILVVEDERITAEDMRKALNSVGYEVPAIVSSGEDAIKVSEEIKPDLVIMDIKLEGEMDGIEAAEKIRSKLGIPIIYLTAYSDEKTVQRAKITEPSGFILKQPYGFLRKPFEESELNTAIEITLYRHRLEKRLRKHDQWLGATLRSISDAVIATDPQAQVRFMNSMAEELTGWLEEDALGHDVRDIFKPIGFKFPLGEDISLKGEYSFNMASLTAKDETTITVNGSVTPINNIDGKMDGFVIIFRSVE